MKNTTLAILLILVSFSVAPVTAAETDPTLVFSTYLGGSRFDYGSDIALDNAGNIYVTGNVGSTDFPATNPFGIAPPGVNTTNIYITKFDPSGTTQLYSIIIGNGKAYGLTVDSEGSAYIVGYATSIATANPIQADYAGGEDAFITKVNPNGTSLIYSTYLGGSGRDVAYDVALDSLKNAYVIGKTTSTNFPTHDPFQPMNAGEEDIFITRLNTAGSAFIYSTYYGGDMSDNGAGIAVDSLGNAYITGDTESNDFPVVNPYQSEHANWCANSSPQNLCTDAYVAKLSPNGVPIYSTYLGGADDADLATAIAIDSLGNVFITGFTSSSDFPTTSNAYQPISPPSILYGIAFITKLKHDGTELMYSTYLGGSTNASAGFGIALDPVGSIIIVGATWATDFPTKDPIQASRNTTFEADDAFISKFSADGQLLFSTYWGGGGSEYYDTSPRLAVDNQGSIYIAGTTSSFDFPTYNAFQDKLSLNDPSPYHDAFVTKIVFPSPSLPAEAAERNYFTTNTPTLTWKPVTWATGYRVQVSKNDQFTGTPDFEGETLATADSITTTHLDDGFYYWRIQTERPDTSWTAWKLMDSFTIDVDE